MRISINLASRPFVELRPLYAKLRLGMAGMALLTVALAVGVHAMSKHVQASEEQMRELKVRASVLTNERLANETKMRQPMNRAVLDRSMFLNSLFARKSFSWTAVMMDLERVLPAGVQVTNIEPAIMAEGEVNIRMRVGGPRENAVDLMRNLEKSQRFLSPKLTNETAQTQEQGRLVPASQMNVPGNVEFDILSGYNPLPAPSKEVEQKTKERNEKPLDQAAGGKLSSSAGKIASKTAVIKRPVKAAASKPVAKPGATAPGVRP